MKTAVVILACAALCGHVLAAPKDGTWNHAGTSIENGGFEDWGGDPGVEVKMGSDGAPLNWLVGAKSGGGSISVMKDTEIKHSGLASARVEVAETGGEASLSQQFSVEPDTSYLVRIWVRGKDIVSATGKAGAGILVWASSGPARAFVPNQKFMRKQPAKYSGTFDWQLFEFPVKTSPEGERLNISLKLQGATGTAWFDDVEVVKSETAAPVKSN
jgi:hyaluronate lyase